MKFYIIHGPNINLLGMREPSIYGEKTYEDLKNFIRECAEAISVDVVFFQSNHEGDLVDYIQDAIGNAEGIIINPAAYTHTSIAILDAVKAVGIPTIEVHLSDITTREDFRRISYVGQGAIHTICGKGFEGYREAIDFLKSYLSTGRG